MHTVMIDNRKTINISGVREVLNFTDDAINAVTEQGIISVRGEGLRIENFNTENGDLSAQGKIIAVVYTKEEKSSLLGRLFR